MRDLALFWLSSLDEEESAVLQVMTLGVIPEEIHDIEYRCGLLDMPIWGVYGLYPRVFKAYIFNYVEVTSNFINACHARFFNDKNARRQEIIAQTQEAKKAYYKQLREKEAIVEVEQLIFKTDFSRCIKKKHELKDMAIRVRQRDGGLSKPFIGHFCKTCEKYFASVQDAEKVVDAMDIDTRILMKYQMSGSANHEITDGFLKGHGYRVWRNDNAAARQQLLVKIHEETKKPYSFLIACIDTLINQKKGTDRCSSAVSKWSEDREFLSSLVDGAETVVAKRVNVPMGTFA